MSQPHHEFLELCALSTTGELTAEEWNRLENHLSHCDTCRATKEQYESVIATAIPSLEADSETDRYDDDSPSTWSIEQAESTLMASLDAAPPASVEKTIVPSPSPMGIYALRYAAAILILSAFAFASYRFGIWRGSSSVSDAVARPIQSPSLRSTLGHVDPEISSESEKPVQVNENTSELNRKLRSNLAEIAKLKEQEAQLEAELADRKADLDRSSQDRAEMDRQLTAAQANAHALQERFSSVETQRSTDDSQTVGLLARVNDLTAALQDKDRKIALDQDLLQHDRDIRNLISARDLYIAEIYDVAKTGDTQKPFGRVFYTKDKSLIFYGYDLDQQPGIKNASTFQAWGRRGGDPQHDVNLGILYLDDSGKKRWVLKSNDATTLAQLDVVFVTVEPAGGSIKPTSKPLLFTYLRLEPNHP